MAWMKSKGMRPSFGATSEERLDGQPGDAAEPEVLRGQTSQVLTIRFEKARK